MAGGKEDAPKIYVSDPHLVAIGGDDANAVSVAIGLRFGVGMVGTSTADLRFDVGVVFVTDVSGLPCRLRSFLIHRYTR